jgi:hypothetical protein
VSRWWNRFQGGILQLALLPDRIEFVTTGGRVEDGQRGILRIGDSGDLSWESVVNSLGNFLDQPMAKRRRLRIVLSDAWVGYRVLPWDVSVVGQRQWGAYARAVFQEIPNGSVEWTVTMERPWPLRNVMACRMPAGLDWAIRDVARQRRLTIDSIHPFFVGTVNRFRPSELAKDFWWVAADEFRVVCGLWRSGIGETGFRGWQMVRNQAIGESFDPLGLIRREEIRTGITDEVLPIVICGRDFTQGMSSERVVRAEVDLSQGSLMALAA